jgi:hypothetical protein
MIQDSSVDFDGCDTRGMVSGKELAFLHRADLGIVAAPPTSRSPSRDMTLPRPEKYTDFEKWTFVESTVS